ncbi:MAG: hypothetical protein JO101_04075 [Candidatus Eremiobacteraeota bacterium]|nr:hypothetical protein [Candidatus Eremiobacteraeota bacterium]MBV8354473.1 hypothetical protein [Candidatus Eremiobacteraeota bacterium]
MSTILSESAPQTITGNAIPEPQKEAEEGKIGTGGPKPEPLQGGGDQTERRPGRESETGSEGDGT